MGDTKAVKPCREVASTEGTVERSEKAKNILAFAAETNSFAIVLGGTAALRLPFGAGGRHFF